MERSSKDLVHANIAIRQWGRVTYQVCSIGCCCVALPASDTWACTLTKRPFHMRPHSFDKLLPAERGHTREIVVTAASRPVREIYLPGLV